MATTTPPPSSSPASPSPPPARPPRRFDRSRLAAFGALAVVVVVLLVLLVGGKGGATYQFDFPEAGQLVRGDQVQVGGVPVGSIKDITLLHDYRVRITVHLDSSLVPLHEGSTAEIRVPSLSSVANRYIALTPGPNNRPKLSDGASVTGSSHEVVDLDQLFDLFNAKTRRGLQLLFKGFAEQYAGAGKALRVDSTYLPPSLAALDHILSELGGDQSMLTSLLVETAKATTTLAGRHQQLTELIGHANTAFGAIGSQQSNLARGLKVLPVALEKGNQTFKELPPTLSDLTKLVNVSKPDTKTLAGFLAKLRPLLLAATPVVNDLNEAIDKPGSGNDLTDAALALPGLATELKTASPDNVKALEESLPITALFGPYTPDLEGLVRDFGQATGYYDASGHYARVQGTFADFALGANNELKPVNPAEALQGLKTGQLRRCPGGGTQPAADGSSPFTDNGQLGCDPTETP